MGGNKLKYAESIVEKIILVRYGEIVLKGLNRPMFEDKLIGNIKKSLQGTGKIKISKSQGRIYIEPEEDDYDFDRAFKRLVKVFGIVSVSAVWKINNNIEEIEKYSLKMVKSLLEKKGYKTFKVATKRGNKAFPMKSPEVNSRIGAYILKNFPSLSVDVHNPLFTLYIEIRQHTYLYSEIAPAFGGLPVGTNGKATLLLSGGIDSPVAGWMMAKRGVKIEAVHFYSYPYTSERAKEKVIELAKILSSFCYDIKLHIVPFTEIQLAINDSCPPEHMTIIMRRVMMMIANRIAETSESLALITGESMGQVASQTIESLSVTNAAVTMPVFRPLIGMDKNEVIEIARKIDTYETSILPYEDCCTLFVAKHPNTKPRIENILLSESKLVSLDEMIKSAVEKTEVLIIKD